MNDEYSVLAAKMLKCLYNYVFYFALHASGLILFLHIGAILLSKFMTFFYFFMLSHHPINFFLSHHNLTESLLPFSDVFTSVGPTRGEEIIRVVVVATFF